MYHKVEKVSVNAEDCTFQVICLSCREKHQFDVSEKALENYSKGEILIQDAFPFLPSGERELLVSGICSNCFDEMFAE
jgi:hypothetical protein